MEAQGPQPQNLLAGEVGAGSVASISPELEAWHNTEKKRIEDECAKMLKNLSEAKRRKLVDIVDKRQTEVKAELAKAAIAKQTWEQEVKDLESQKVEAKHEASKIPGEKADAKHATGLHDTAQDRVDKLRQLIAEKKGCIDKLKIAREKIQPAMHKLDVVREELAEKEAWNARQQVKIEREERHVKKETGHVDTADKAKDVVESSLDDLLARLKKAEDDIKEHDMTASPPTSYPSGATNLLLHGANYVEASPGSALPGAKSGSKRTVGVGAAGVAWTLAAFLF